MSSPTEAADSIQPPFAAVTAGQSLQERTLAAWTFLGSQREDWGGALILSCGLGPVGSAVALAANVAGAACLAIEPDAAVSRTAMRAGVCDFFVNTVDEALRGLKNEIRQRKPLSVALELDTSAALGELMERGVMPELFAANAASSTEAVAAVARSLRSDGALVADFGSALPQIQDFLGQRNLTVRIFAFENGTTLKLFDDRLKETIPAADFRRAWVRAAPRLFHRERPLRRATLLREEELKLLRKEIRGDVFSL